MFSYSSAELLHILSFLFVYFCLFRYLVQLKSIQKHTICLIFPFTREISYSCASLLLILHSRRHDLLKSFFQDICDPLSCTEFTTSSHVHVTLPFYPGSEQSHIYHNLTSVIFYFL